MNLNISAVNDAPAATFPASVSIGENATTALTGISFSDADAGSASVTVTLGVPAGSLSASSGGGVAIGGTSSALTLTGSIADINAFIAASNVSYAPALNDNGTRVLTGSIDDGGNSGSGGTRSDLRTVTLNITNANDAPTPGEPPFTIRWVAPIRSNPPLSVGGGKRKRMSYNGISETIRNSLPTMASDR